MGASVFFESASELATLTNTFTVGGTLTDPTTITLVITDPQGALTTYTFALAEITKVSVGLYRKDITCSLAGEWQYEWVGTGAAVDTEVGTWTVLDTTLGRLYATLQTLKSRLGLASTDTADDYELHTACFAASRAVEQYCQRTFWRGDSDGEARTFIPDDGYCVKLPPFCDLVSVVSLKADASGDGVFDTTWAASDYQLLPHNPGAAPELRPYTELKAVGTRTFPLPTAVLARDDRVEITGVWGWPAVPYGVKQSALITAAEVFKSKSTFEAQMGFDEMAQFVLRRNPIARDLIKPYRHLRATVLVA
jgi:hypothetical protein